MGQRRHHYESAFEHYLRDRRVPYVMVDEAKKALLPPDAPLRLLPPPDSTARPLSLKSFDFVLYGQPTNYLAEIKGRRLPTHSKRLESWVTRDDLESLGHWQSLFGEPFRAAFIFLYWCDELPPVALFEELFEHHGRWYAVRAIELDAYKSAMRERSARWRTVHLPSEAFDRLSKPLCGALAEASHSTLGRQ